MVSRAIACLRFRADTMKSAPTSPGWSSPSNTRGSCVSVSEPTSLRPSLLLPTLQPTSSAMSARRPACGMKSHASSRSSSGCRLRKQQRPKLSARRNRSCRTGSSVGRTSTAPSGLRTRRRRSSVRASSSLRTSYAESWRRRIVSPSSAMPWLRRNSTSSSFPSATRSRRRARQATSFRRRSPHRSSACMRSDQSSSALKRRSKVLGRSVSGRAASGRPSKHCRRLP